MINFITFEDHQYTIQLFIDYTKCGISKVLTYESFQEQDVTSNDLIVLCDIDRCNDTKLFLIINIYEQIIKIGCKVLNNPYAVLRRYPLLKTLYDRQYNSYNVYRANSTDLSLIKYPVFLREEYEHNGPISSLLDNLESLKDFLKQKSSLIDLLICEFVDTSNSHIGFFHKYGAFYFNGIVIPRHLFISSDWCVKGQSSETVKSIKLERNYLENNPHEGVINEIFKLAKIDYGRIDYAITKSGIQVFEINTNPTVIDRWDIDNSSSRFWVTKHFIEKFIKILDSN